MGLRGLQGERGPQGPPGQAGEPKGGLIATCVLTSAAAFTPTNASSEAYRLGTWTVESPPPGTGSVIVRGLISNNSQRIQLEGYTPTPASIGFTAVAEVGGTEVSRAFIPLGPGAIADESDESGETTEDAYGTLRLSSASLVRVRYRVIIGNRSIRLSITPVPSGYSGATPNAWLPIPANATVKVYEGYAGRGPHGIARRRRRNRTARLARQPWTRRRKGRYGRYGSARLARIDGRSGQSGTARQARRKGRSRRTRRDGRAGSAGQSWGDKANAVRQATRARGVRWEILA